MWVMNGARKICNVIYEINIFAFNLTMKQFSLFTKNSFVSLSRLICTVKHSARKFHCYNFSNISKFQSVRYFVRFAQVHLHVGHHNVVSTLCVGSETLTGLGAIDTCATKKLLFVVGSFLKRRLSYIIM